MTDSTAHRIAKICEDSDTVAINPVTGVFAVRSGAKLTVPIGQVLSAEYNDYRRVVSTWIKYRDGSRLHYRKGKKDGKITAKAYIRKPHFNKHKGLVLPAKFLGIRKDGEAGRVMLIDNANDWIRDIRHVGTVSTCVFRLLAVWMHERYPLAPTANYLKVRNKSDCWAMAARAGVAFTPITHGRSIIGYEYQSVAPWTEPVLPIKQYACAVPDCPGTHRKLSDKCKVELPPIVWGNAALGLAAKVEAPPIAWGTPEANKVLAAYRPHENMVCTAALASITDDTDPCS